MNHTDNKLETPSRAAGQNTNRRLAYEKPAVLWLETLDVKTISVSFTKCQSSLQCVAAGNPDPGC